MSKFLEINEDAYTPMHFVREVSSYILKEFPTQQTSFSFSQKIKGNEEEIVRLLCNQMPDVFRMYGSPREILENVKVFSNFSGNWRHLRLEDEPYQVPPMIYHSLKNEKYICKSDLFAILQNMIRFDDDHASIEYVNVMALFLKSREESLKGNMDFVRFDEKVLTKIAAEIRADVIKKKRFMSLELQPVMEEISALNYEEYIEKIERMIGGEWIFNRKIRLRMLIHKACNTATEEHLPAYYAILYLTFRTGIESLTKIIDKHPELFLPRKPSSPVRVRLFEDGNQRFVMKSEVSNALNRRLDSEDDENLFFTMEMDEVLQKFGKEEIEFIRYPITRAKHRGTPIKGPTPSEHFLILAVDAFFEFFRSLIFGYKIFQNTDFGEFFWAFQEFEKYFKPDCDQPYFICADFIVPMKKTMEYCLHVGSTRVSAKDVRNAKPDGFTLQNLKNELKYLGLTETFPEIHDYAEVVYSHVDQNKKMNILRTCDLFDAVEICQLICVLNRIPNYKKFLHNQKGCGRILGYECEHCGGEMEILNSMKNLKIGEPISNKYAQPALSAPQFCEKCSESSESLIKTQNELKISQDQVEEMKEKALDTENKLKDLKKNHEKIVDSETKKSAELSKLGEELKTEKQKIQEKEEEILKATQDNEELQKTILKLTTENETNDRVIQQLLDRITNLSINNQENSQNDTQNTSMASKNVPLVIDCLICSKQIKSGEEVIRCPLCKRRFHSNCAFKWRKDHSQCPACNGDLPGI